MARRKTVTLKGAAATAYFLQFSGHAPRTEEDALLGIVTRIHMEMSAENTAGAVAILKAALKGGPLEAARTLAGLG